MKLELLTVHTRGDYVASQILLLVLKISHHGICQLVQLHLFDKMKAAVPYAIKEHACTCKRRILFQS